MKDLEKVCSSNKSYKEKIDELKALKVYAELNINAYEEYIKSIEDSKEKLDSDYYLYQMIDRKNRLINGLIVKIPSAILSALIGTNLTMETINLYMGKLGENDIIPENILSLIVGTAMFDTLALALTPNVIRDIYNAKLYKNEISTYKRRLR